MNTRVVDETELLLAKYPTVREAVSFTEYIVCGDVDGESGWDLMMRAKASPDKVLRGIQVAADDCGGDCGVPADILTAIRSQVRHPDFRTYLAGKLGLL